MRLLQASPDTEEAGARRLQLLDGCPLAETDS
jgi:hypothetical protein